jgi:hypothetical protein
LSVLTTGQKGAIAETAIAHEATKLGIEVYRPIAEGGRFDMIFLLGEELARVQCKWAREGLRRRVYTADEVDAFAAYCPNVDRCFIPFGAIPARSQILLRLGPTRNNQRQLVNWAKDFEFAATLGRHPGAIAQLGERRHGMAEVVGSSPTGSTLFPSARRPRSPAPPGG